MFSTTEGTPEVTPLLRYARRREKISA